MGHSAIDRVITRVENAKSDSDFTYFFSLLILGEALFKTIVLGMVSAIRDDKDRNRYRLEYSLARADGLGDWSKVLDDALSGPASQFLDPDAYTEQAELTRVCAKDSWQAKAVEEMKTVLNALNIKAEDVPEKTDLRRWFRFFSTLRNGTRGHGATLPAHAALAATHLFSSINAVYEKFQLFNRPWAHLYRSLSGKYRVSGIAGDLDCFQPLKRVTDVALPNGVYINFGSPRLVPLYESDPDLQDFYIGNGGFSINKFEVISYATDDKKSLDAQKYLMPPGSLPTSETQGLTEFVQLGTCMSNVPRSSPEYVSRPELEHELFSLLKDDRRPIITLVGRGGIGKTSLALATLAKVASESRFEVIIWFSARDIDLLPEGPKTVRPHVLSPDDVSSYYVSLVSPDRLADKKFGRREFFEQQLQTNELGPTLYVFDNFETSQNPVELFNWIDTFIRLPNKVLITTRLHEFKGDYPVEVKGMSEDEAIELVRRTSMQLGISGIVTKEYSEKLVSEAEGHPYVIKILLGEVSREKRLENIPRLMANREEILTALFERTYASLSPICQRVFMTLAAWNSMVPRVAIEAVVLRSSEERIDVAKAIDRLHEYSMVEIVDSGDRQEFISLPLVASVFGRKKMNVSPIKAAVQADLEFLHLLGPTKRGDIQFGFGRKMQRLVSNVAEKIEKGTSIQDYLPILEMICQNYNPGWLMMARWLLEIRSDQYVAQAKTFAQRYLENSNFSSGFSEVSEAWGIVAVCCRIEGDLLGEIHAFIERCHVDSVPFYDLSNTANRLNSLLRDHQLDIEKEEKIVLAKRILDAMEARLAEANADDLSRMAWLALHLGMEPKAMKYISDGLAMDPNNHHCFKLADKFKFKLT